MHAYNDIYWAATRGMACFEAPWVHQYTKQMEILVCMSFCIHSRDSNQYCVVGRKTAFRDVCTQIPKACEYVSLYGKTDIADKI